VYNWKREINSRVSCARACTSVNLCFCVGGDAESASQRPLTGRNALCVRRTDGRSEFIRLDCVILVSSNSKKQLVEVSKDLGWICCLFSIPQKGIPKLRNKEDYLWQF
jgi:hypothetical protein